MKLNSSWKSLLSLFIILAMGSAGCAALKKTSPEQSLGERVEAMMQAKMNNDWGTVYTFFDETFQKQESKEVFANKPREMVLKSYTIESMEINSAGNEATVKIKSDIQARGFDFKGTPETQQWIMETGVWRLQVPIREESKE